MGKQQGRKAPVNLRKSPSWSVESTVAYWFPRFAMASGEAVSSCKLFGIASTLMSSEISLGSLCWAGLAKALGRASARRRMREAEVMENSTWEREELRKSGLQLKEVGGSNRKQLEGGKSLVNCHETHNHTRFDTRRADRQHDAVWHYGMVHCRKLFRNETAFPSAPSICRCS